ncbi:MAG TPA: hypothetical protein VFF60_06265 [Candidatus Binatus sp.]|nr:hypothetical protein [Candidatus Binatus sp.]
MPSHRLRPEAQSAIDLDRRILEFIATASAGEDEFNRLALDLFEYQYQANEPYRRYCDRFGVSPASAERWTQVPAIPTSAFAPLRLACFQPDRTRWTFFSSGTTRSNRSRLELEDTALYDASLAAHFRERVLPDRPRIRMLALAPSAKDAPHSSLSYMLSAISRTFGTARDGFFMHGDALDFAGAIDALRGASEPVLVAATAFAFVHFFDRCAREDLRFALPAGSRVIETGGFKGKSRSVERDELYGWFVRVLGVPRELCAAEYGMCELGSQWYDANIADSFARRTPRYGVKVGPHWARARIVDPVSAQPLPKGETGLLQVFDLSNRGSVCAVLTGDLAREADGGLELLGRAPGEPPKGCSIAVDAALSVRA